MMRNGQPFFFQGDHLLGAVMEYILGEFPGAKIVCDIKTSYALREYIHTLGGEFVETNTGHSNIKKLMKQIGAVLGGEQSAHIYPGWNGKNGYFDDALQAALLMLIPLNKAGKDLDRFLGNMPEWNNTPDIRFPYTKEYLAKFDNVEQAGQKFEEMVLNEMSRKRWLGIKIDERTGERYGVKAFFNSEGRDGWGLVRASGTDTVVSTRIDAWKKEDFEHIASEIYTFLKSTNALDMDAEEFDGFPRGLEGDA